MLAITNSTTLRNGGNAPHGGTTKSSTAVCHGFRGHWNTAFNFDLHFGGAAAKTVRSSSMMSGLYMKKPYPSALGRSAFSTAG